MDRPSSRHGAGGGGMARPGSRGGGMPPSMPAPAGAGANPYVQAQQPMMGGLGGAGLAGGRPGTGLGGGARPGSGMRQPPPGSAARQGTAAGGGGPKSFSGIGMNTSVAVAHRPVTQQGMRGSTAAGARAGPGRQIQDRNFFLGELRARCTAVDEETARLQRQADASSAENATYGALERRYQTLSNEMRALQGRLADYNLLLDRSRSGREVADIFDEVAQLKAANGAERERADALFSERQNVEGHARQLEGALHDHSQRLAERMSELPEADQRLFAQLQEAKAAMLIELPHRQALLAGLTERVAAAEAAVSRDAARAEMAALREQTRAAARRVDELKSAASDVPLTADEQRAQLLASVKQQNAEIVAAERAAAENVDAAKRHRVQLAAVDAELAKAGARAGAHTVEADAKEAKLEQLHARDAEMQALIDTFDETHAAEEARLVGLRAAIVGTLTASSRAIEASATLAAAVDGDGSSAYGAAATPAALDELQSELAFKTDQKEAAERTAGRLQGERERRRAELAKVQTLDAKIAHELTQLTDKMAAMRSELGSFRDVRQLKDEANERRTRLTAARTALRARQDASRRAGAARKAAYEEAKAALARDETASSLEASEQKLRHYESSIFLLAEYIHAKGRESDFESLKGDCTSMLSAINTAAITAARR
ncbi:hypothetical protein KFE25_006601 [Diacronema lutheri]|uniref:Intraflagellar transport protein 74 homolog n=2 Tax=Diacronema lutheri TaxID=2081491 RepID=A0A8J5X3S0_DIALT|nr:hypothetical protein KFE25_006601 [Diacronema lutheri]